MVNDPGAPGGPAARPLDGWKHRRRLVYFGVFYCAAMILYLTERHPESPVVGQTITGLLALLGTILLGYIGGAVVDDWNKMRGAR